MILCATCSHTSWLVLYLWCHWYQNGVQGAGGVSEEILESGDADLDGMWPHDEEGPRVPASTLLEPSASVWDSVGSPPSSRECGGL